MRIILSLLLVISVSPVLTAADYAVLVGVEKYGKSTGLNDLVFPEDDVEALASLLIENGYKKDNVVVLTQPRSVDDPELSPTLQNIERELDLILKNLSASDSVVLAFAGHGVKFRDADPSYFCPINCELGKRANLLSYDSLYKRLLLCQAGRKLLLSDACRNDPLSASARSSPSLTRPEPVLPPGSTVALFACKAGQEAREDKDLKHGVFFHYVLEGLRGKADQPGDDSIGNGNKIVELTELAQYAQNNVRNHVRVAFRTTQEPELKTHVDNIQNLLRYPVLVLKSTPLVMTNSIGMELRLIPAGEFRMGSTKADVDSLVQDYASQGLTASDVGDEQPQHRVQISQPFYLGKFEVTKGQFAEFVRDSSYRTDAEKDGEGGWGYDPVAKKFEGRKPQYTWRSTGFKNEDDHPVVNISWNDAEAFCTWLSRKEGTTYRLPTEAEWEYACRAGTTSRHPNGDDESSLVRIANIGDQKLKSTPGAETYTVAGFNDGHAFTAPVGSFATNKFGLHDMIGNVWEWCEDTYDAKAYTQRGALSVDPRNKTDEQNRVLRGGSWLNLPRSTRSANRNRYTPDYRDINYGFRVVCVRGSRT